MWAFPDALDPPRMVHFHHDHNHCAWHGGLWCKVQSFLETALLVGCRLTKSSIGSMFRCPIKRCHHAIDGTHGCIQFDLFVEGKKKYVRISRMVRLKQSWWKKETWKEHTTLCKLCISFFYTAVAQCNSGAYACAADVTIVHLRVSGKWYWQAGG